MIIMVDFNSLISILSGAAGGVVSSGTLKEPVNSLDDSWYVSFEYKGDLARQKGELLNVQGIIDNKR